MACWEMVVQASAALAKPPKGPEDLVGLGVAEGAAASDAGALPELLACGAEQAVSARTVNRAAARGRAESFTSHISVEDSFC